MKLNAHLWAKSWAMALTFGWWPDIAILIGTVFVATVIAGDRHDLWQGTRAIGLGQSGPDII